MRLLHRTLLFCVLSFVKGFFQVNGPKPTSQTGANGWGMLYVGKWTPRNPSFSLGPWDLFSGAKKSSLPEVTSANDLLSVKVTSSTIQPTTLISKKTLNSVVQPGTLPPLNPPELPTADLYNPPNDPNYDLNLWPPNDSQSTAKTPQTTSSEKTKPVTETYTSSAQRTSATPTTLFRSTTESSSLTVTKEPLSTSHSSQVPRFPTPEDPNLVLSSQPLASEDTKNTTWIFSEATNKSLPGLTWTEQENTGSTVEGRQQSSAPDSSTTPHTQEHASQDEDKEDQENQENADLPTQERQTEATRSAGSLRNTEPATSFSEDWLTDFTQESALPDCNAEHSGICSSVSTWATFLTNDSKNDSTTTISTNFSQTPILLPDPPMLVALYSDWNSALATWGLAWELHIYGLGSIFCVIALVSALNLLCLPLQYPSGCGYFALVSLSLVSAGCTRAFALLYDAYGYQDRMASYQASLLLYEAPFPCMTAAFGLVFLLLSMRSRMQLSYSAFQRPCILACLVLLHFAAAFGPIALLHVDQPGASLYRILTLISRGAFVALATFLSAAYFVFYCYVRADSKHIYHLNNTSPTPAERFNRCPFAESRDWDRSAATVLLSAVFSLTCAGLQLYAMLHALGLAGGIETFQPWPWWAFQFSCRLCEALMCLTLVLVVAQPVYCSDHLPHPGSCWAELLTGKSPKIPGTYQWSLTNQEKLAICDPIGQGETEYLPLYTLVDDRLSSLNGLDLLYHSNRALAYRDLDLDLPNTQPNTGLPSIGSSWTSDSTTDLHPPSPINLRRSIDEALFSESLFPMSLFSPLRPFTSSDRSLDIKENNSTNAKTQRDTLMPDPGLYRTSSCLEVQPQPPLSTQFRQDDAILGFPPPSPSPSPSSSMCCSTPEHWRGSSSSCSLYRQSLAGSSLVLCSSPEVQFPLSTITCSNHSNHHEGNIHRPYRALNSQESVDQPSEFDHSVQEEFISVCRQIDALSVCSETIDL